MRGLLKLDPIMKIQSWLQVWVVAGAFTACSTNSNPSSTAVQPRQSTTAQSHSEPLARARAAAESPATRAPVPEVRELRALLEHSLVTGRNAHAFMELFAGSDTEFQEFMEHALVNNDYPAKPKIGIGPIVAPDFTVQK